MLRYKSSLILSLYLAIISVGHSPLLAGEQVVARLNNMSNREIEAYVRLKGDPQRGALLFHTSAAGCIKCHAADAAATPLGPDLAKLGPEATVSHIVESLLDPSKKIRKGFETVAVVTVDGKVQSGLISQQTDNELVLRDAKDLLKEIAIPREEIEEVSQSKVSMMPQGLIAALHDEREFFDLVRYIYEVAQEGPQRQAELRPAESALAVKDDTQDLDHARIIQSLSENDLKVGRRIFNGHCVNCHGADGNTPKLATARAFGKDSLKYGSDPYRMLLTVSRGAGLMAPLTHLSPKERYQVIYYVRETLMKGRNPDYKPVDESYLASLPKGTNLGNLEEAGDRDFGPVLGSQLGNQVNNGLTFRLQDDVSVCYDLHRMQIAAAWQGGFLNLSQTQHYRQRGERMPQIDGKPLPGLGEWAWSYDGSFEIPEDAKPPRGPVRSDWLTYHGHYLHNDRAILSYAIHGREILESIEAATLDEKVSLIQTLHIAAGDEPLQLSVAKLSNTGGPTGLLPQDNFKFQKFGKAVEGGLAVITGQAAKREIPQAHQNRPWHVVKGKKARQLDLGTPGRSIAVRFRSDESGTLIASTPAAGEWKPNGKTLFLRGGRLVYDIGWVGAMTSRSRVNDGKWHTAVLTVEDDFTRLYIDGQLEAERQEFRRDAVNAFVLKIGATATNFGGDLEGEIEWIQIINQVLTPNQIKNIEKDGIASSAKKLFEWTPKQQVETTEQDELTLDWGLITTAQVHGDITGLTWEQNASGRLVLNIPASSQDRKLRIVRMTLSEREELIAYHEFLSDFNHPELNDLTLLTHGGEQRWPEKLEVKGQLGEAVNGYALDSISVPFENPWNAWLRTSALDFFADGRCVVTTHGGNVYLVDGIDKQLNHITWKRFAAGLFEPFGVKVVDGMVYVTCRDGLKRLHDFNGDDEADFIEAFWIDDDLSNSFHAYNFDLQTDSAGNFYFAKAGQYTQHHRPGTIMRVPPSGGEAEVVAWGLRTPNGMGKLWDDRFTVSDNQGPWMPAGKVSLIRPGSFLGNMPINDAQEKWLKARHGGQLPETFDEPLVWTPQELDNSCGGQVWAGDERFGPLAGRMIHSSFGKGWLYSMSLQEVGEVMQGALISLPHQWQAGVMRLRMNPVDGQLYGTGLSGWQGPTGGADGCLQRLRYTGEEVQMIDHVRIVPDGIELTLTFPVDDETATNPNSYRAEMWDYLWSRRYGSDQFSVKKPGERGHDELSIKQAKLLGKNRLLLVIPDLAICDQLWLRMNFLDKESRSFAEEVYMTIHAIPESD